MRISKIRIIKYGKIDKLELSLKRTEAIKTPFITEVVCAISEILYCDYLRQSLPKIQTDASSRIYGYLLFGGKKITLVISFINNKPKREYFIGDKKMGENTCELPIQDDGFEQEMVSLFVGNDLLYKNRYVKNDYKNYFAFFKGSKIKKLPSGDFLYLYHERFFRFLLNYFIIGFKPIWIDKEKGVYIKLSNNGVFKAFRNCDGFEEEYGLSKLEQSAFDFICFLEIAKFWCEIKSAKNFHYESKPLIVISSPDNNEMGFNAFDYVKKLKSKRQFILLYS